MKSNATRREFLKQTGGLVAGAAAAASAVSEVAGAAERAIPAAAKVEEAPVAAKAPAYSGGERIKMGIIGPAGRGERLLKTFLSFPDVEIIHLADIDQHHLADAESTVAATYGKSPKATQDLREVLANKDVQAVVIATPDHWHAPATILACEAGKHVYCEKPASQNLREGRLMIETARRTNRVVQIGMQSRSADYIQRAMKLLHDGAIGEVLVSKAWNSQRRVSIEHRQPSEPPKHVDYDMWVGPAEWVPYQSNRFHSVWRWWHNFGTGDIGNDGVHDIDIARWGLGVTRHPDRVSGSGAKYFFDDDQEYPDTYTMTYEYDSDHAGKRKQFVYEQRTWSPYTQEGYENGCAFYGTKGVMLLGKAFGWQLFGEKNQFIKKEDGKLTADAHCRNFIDCVRSGQRPNCDIEIGHLSSSLSHLGNIAARTGRTIRFDPQSEKIVGDAEANGLTRRKYRAGGHWAMPKGV